MLLKFFRRISPEIIFLNIIILFAIWSGTFFLKQESSFFYDVRPMPLYGLMKNLAGNGLSGSVISFFLILLISYILVNFNTDLFFIPERTYLPSILYALFTGFFVSYQALNPVVPATLLLLLALRRIMDGYRKNGTAFGFFDAAFLTGIGTLFYANLIWFGFLLITGVIILRGYNIKELMLSVTGLLAPFLITAGVYYVLSYNPLLLAEDFSYNIFTEAGENNFSWAEITAVAVSVAGVFKGIFFLFPRIKSMKIRSRKIFILLLWWFVISLALYVLLPGVSAEIIYLGAVPSVYFISYYLIFGKNTFIREFLFAAILLLAVSVQIVRYL